MATAAAVSYEVRYRVLGSGTAWSDVVTFKVGAELKLTGLDRTKQYEVEARGVSRCGARSLWGNQQVTVDDANQRVTQSNLSLTNVGGIRSAWVGLTISYSATTTSTTVNTTAATLQAGDSNIDYAAASATLYQAAPGQTFTYYMFFDDPQGVGGVRPLGFSGSYEDLSAAPGRVFVGTISVTWPTSGSSSGGGSAGGGGPGGHTSNQVL